MIEQLEKFFKFKENKTNFRTETVAGITSFFGIAYILAVNPVILSSTGMNEGSVYTATALASALGTLLMALMTNYPFVLAPGMGINAYFAYTVCLQMGYSWETALTAVFIEGIIFILLTLSSIREKLFAMIPVNLRHAITCGIGLFIAMIGLINAQIIVDDPGTFVSIYSWADQVNPSTGLTVILAIIGILLTAFFYIKGLKIGILLGILVTWGLGIICQLTGLYVPDPAAGLYSLLPDFSHGLAISSLSPTFLKFDFSGIFSIDFLIVIFAFLFVDTFDTIGTLMGCSLQAGYIHGKEELPHIKQALLADALATTAGACLGTSTVTTVVESGLGVAQGGRTGFTGIVVVLLFLVSLFLSPIFLAIPSWATAPALVIVGFLMMHSVSEIDFTDPLEGIPAFLCLISMPMFYSIAEGIGWGIISYTVLHVLTGKAKDVSPLMYATTILYILKYALI